MTHRRFSIHFQKALQATGYFLSLAGGTMEYLRLMKLLYLADRECLAEEGMTITGDRMSALPQGPVLSTVMKLFSGKDSQSDVWRQYVKRAKGQVVSLRCNPGVDNLYQFEKDMINHIFERYHDVPINELVDMTHLLPEWEKYQSDLNDPQKKNSYPITVEDILHGIGKPEILVVVEEHIAEARHYQRLFGN